MRHAFPLVWRVSADAQFLWIRALVGTPFGEADKSVEFRRERKSSGFWLQETAKSRC
jgi:hypothetical protein